MTDLAPRVSGGRVRGRLARALRRPRTAADWAEGVVTAVVLLGCVVFTLLALHPSKLFLNTTPAGGDMGAHVWAPWFLKNHLFPHGRISGWAPDWYDGFPALTYYFPGPYTAIALLSYVVPYGVAFKLVSVSGVVSLPLAAYAFGRLTGMRLPGPQLLAVAAVPFLFDRYWTIWGGNIASTLAGEFAFSISLSLALLFIGVFSLSMRTGRYRWLAALLLAGTLFSHLLPTFFAIAGAGVVWLLAPGRRRLRRAVLIAVAGFGVTAWWLVPFAVRLGYSNDMGWERSTAFMKGLFPFLCNSHKADSSINCPSYAVVHPYTVHLELVVALAAAGVLGGVILRRRATLLVAGLGLVFAAAFRFMPQGTLWNARMLPFWYLMLYFAAASCVAESALAVGVLLGHVPRRAPAAVDWGPDDLEAAPVGPDREPPADRVWDDAWEGWAPDGADGPGERELVPSRWPAIVVPLLALALVLAFVGQTIPDFQGFFTRLMGHYAIGGADQRTNQSFVSGWANWNYSGYQQKASWPEYSDVVTTMARVGQQDGCGRAMWEYESEEDRFGTPMALMLLPMWTNGCIGSEEGLFFESSAMVPYHFLNQSELSQAPSRAMRDLPYRNYDIVNGLRHMQLLGVRYYMAITPASQAAAQAQTTGPDPLLRLVAKTGTHQVSYTQGATTGEQPRHWEIYEIADSAPVSGLSYLPAVMRGVSTTGRGWINTVVPWYQDSTRWPVELAASGPSDWPRVTGASATPPHVAVAPAVVTNIATTDDRISFDVDHTGTPVLVKTSYFPNWQATGANGPWRVAPNLMVVLPTSRHVELHYGFTPVDNIGRVLSVGGLAMTGLLWWGERSGGGGGGGLTLPVEDGVDTPVLPGDTPVVPGDGTGLPGDAPAPTDEAPAETPAPYDDASADAPYAPA